MNTPPPLQSDANVAQAEFWNSAPGQKWIEHERVLDFVHAPVSARILELADLPEDAHVLDIGCGTGDMILEIARRVPNGSATGADISAQLLERARHRAKDISPQPEFLLADVQTATFTRRYSHIVSRFGLMFFADPIAAFRNIAEAAQPGHTLTFATWGPPDPNVWFNLPKEAAERQLGPGPKTDPRAPGPLAFKDVDYVKDLLGKSGWTSIQAHCEIIDLAVDGPATQFSDVAMRLGPAARIALHHNASDADIAAISADIAAGFARYQTADGLRLPAAINFVTCRAPALNSREI